MLRLTYTCKNKMGVFNPQNLVTKIKVPQDIIIIQAIQYINKLESMCCQERLP